MKILKFKSLTYWVSFFLEYFFYVKYERGYMALDRQMGGNSRSAFKEWKIRTRVIETFY